MTLPARMPRVFLLLSFVLLAGCASNPAMEQARTDLATGDEVAALGRLAAEVSAKPENRELRAFYLRQRERVILQRLAAAERANRAGQTGEAARLYEDIERFAPGDPRAEAGQRALAREARHAAMLSTAQAAFKAGDAKAARAEVARVLTEDPEHAAARALDGHLQAASAEANPAPDVALRGPFAKPVTLEFRDAPLRIVFEALSRAAGLNFVFDRDVRAEAKVTLFVRNSTVDEVLQLLTATQKIERKILNANSVLIYPSTPAKTKEYRELVTRSFYLSNADVKQAQALVRTLTKSRDVFADEKLRLLVIKDTPEAVALAERLLSSLDVAEPEVMLEVEVLEVSRNKVIELGLDFPDQVGLGALDGTGVARTLASGVVDLRSRGDLRPYVANPALLLNLRQEDGDTSLLANPRIRVKNNEEAKIHIGDKLPVFTTTATANVGVSASVTYLDVGLKLDVKPQVLLSGDVEIKVGLEVSNIVKEVTGPSASLAYQVGTRTAATVLRLKNGETQILAGLLQEEDRMVGNRVPGVGDIPLIGRLFSSQKDTNNRTEIVLLITPRVIRNVVVPTVARAEMSAGTETNIGAEPLSLRPTAPGSLSLSGDNSPVLGGNGPGALAARMAQRRAQALAARAAAAPEAVNPGDAAPDEGERESESPESSAGPLAVSVSGPSEVTAGGSVEVSVAISGGGAIAGGEVTLQYDPGRIEAAGATTPGSVTVAIPAGQDTVSTSASFTTRAGSIGTVRIAPVSASVERDGRTETVSPSGSVSLTIKP
ncbi:secretin N-terminal domain-containing protein [Denitromonas ohlonensis]|uniref:General secretion pathway protein GspD n=2 Tax=Denitromonas TaxID=139331 RepID=A0A557SMI8_9RHOO|nr:secretin N-terminal domain-containing protein [Denitromonas ohlonensis]TVO60459.1 general secretion pathway protein GspD [Denitromonas ohlonensis]TVO78624.1 general secretion pathway protein GspD [Denitromonas ohlonensis]